MPGKASEKNNSKLKAKGSKAHRAPGDTKPGGQVARQLVTQCAGREKGKCGAWRDKVTGGVGGRGWSWSLCQARKLLVSCKGSITTQSKPADRTLTNPQSLAEQLPEARLWHKAGAFSTPRGQSPPDRLEPTAGHKLWGAWPDVSPAPSWSYDLQAVPTPSDLTCNADSTADIQEEPYVE